MSALPRPHSRIIAGAARVLIIEVPGWPLTRVAVERTVTALGWGIALTPADAEVVVVCGRPSDAWDPVIDRLSRQVPGPRGGVHPVTAAQDAALVLQRAATSPMDPAPRRGGSVVGGAEGHRSFNDGADGADTNGRNGTEQSADDRDRTDHTDDTEGTDDDMDGMDMPMPGGIPLAGGDQDRDGLEMDVLTIPLGPVLPFWPAGLELRCSLHGDMIAQAEVTAFPGLDAGEYRRGNDVRVDAALECDGVARLLALAGRGDAAASVSGIRDALLDGASAAACSAAVVRWTDRLRRSRLLRWSLSGLGRIGEAGLPHEGLPDALAGDVRDRLLARLGAIAGSLARPGAVDDPAVRGEASAAVLDLLPTLVTGLELGAARLVVASMDPDIAALQRGAADA